MHKSGLASSLLSLCLPAVLQGQATPTVAPVASPVSAPGTVASVSHAPSAGDLIFSLSGSEAIQNGYEGVNGTSTSTNLSGTASFISNSELHPLSLVYSGGYLFGDNAGYPASSFQNFGVSQAVNTRNWRFSVADLVSYLPAAPVFGVSGVPGVGDVGTVPIDIGNLPTQSILTNYNTRVTNTVSGSANRKITGSTSAYGFGAYGIQRFPDGLGIANDQVTGSGGINHRFNALNSGGLNYSYYRFTYSTLVPGVGDGNFYSHGVNAEYLHTFNRKFSLTLTGGPQWTRGNDSAVIASRINAAASATLYYVGELSHASVTYARGSNNGSGVLFGAISDNLDFAFQRAFGRNWEAGLIANYGHASGLISQNRLGTSTDSFYGGIQGTRRLGRYFSVYGSYNGQTQSVNGLPGQGQGQTANGTNAFPLVFSGVASVVSFGVTYSPKPIHLGHL